MPPRRPRKPARPQVEELETRLLLSADAGMLLDPALADVADELQPAVLVEPLETHVEQTETSPRRELAFVDTGVEGFEQLITDLRAAAGTRELEIVLLDSTRDGIAEISATLERREGLDAIHIVSHGANGSVRLGSSWLDDRALEDNASVIAGWGDALAADADLLFYGCDLASDDQGRAFVDSLSTLVGADVAASTDLTGVAELGGDFELEYRAGQVETTQLLSGAKITTWHGTLGHGGPGASGESVVDYFEQQSYDNQDGSLNWDGPWQESDAAGGGAQSGWISVAGDALRITAGAEDDWIQRTVQLGDTTSAHLQFDANNQLVGSGRVRLRISDDGGVTWSSSADFTASKNQGNTSWYIDLDNLASTELTVRFLVKDASPGSSLTISEMIVHFDSKEAGTGVAIWSENGAPTPESANFDGNDFDAVPSPTANIDGPWRIIAGAEAPTRDEKIVLGLDADNNISGMIWDGTDWSALPTPAGLNDIATIDSSTIRAFDVAYESQSGDALVIFSDTSGGTTTFSYVTWDGSSWNDEGPFAVTASAQRETLRLVSSPTSDEIILVASTKSGADLAMVWNGSTWRSPVALHNGIGAIGHVDVSVAYEQSGEALVVWGESDSLIHYRKWNGSWGAEQTLSAPPSVVGQPQWTTLASDPASNRIALGVTSSDAQTWLAVWDGSGWESATVATSAVSVTTTQNMDVAFESGSGDAIAVYGTTDSWVRYRTWTAEDGWSAEDLAVDVGATPNTIALDADPRTNRMILGVQNANSDLVHAPWYGMRWGEPSVRESDTGEIANQPFIFLWDDTFNRPPTIAGGPFSISEHATSGSLVGEMTAKDPDDGDQLKFSIIDGNDDGAFAIDADSGEIEVVDGALLDFETTRVYTLEIEVKDDGRSAGSSSISVTIDLIDENDAPSVTGGPFSVDEDAAVGTVVGRVASSDPDAGQTLHFTMDGGDGAFAIHEKSGRISVADPSKIVFADDEFFELEIKVGDDGTPAQETTVFVRINVIANAAPSLSGGPFAIDEDAGDGDWVGTVVGSDPEGDDLRYAIVGGNPNDTFAIDPDTGEITLKDASQLDHETRASYNLSISVRDGAGPGAASVVALVRVDIGDVNETPVVSAETFVLPENSADGTLVGTLAATDPDVGDVLLFSIKSGDPDGAFEIDESSGEIRVLDSSRLDFEITPVFDLEIEVRDDAATALAGSAIVRIELVDQNEAPTVSGGPFAVAEHSPIDTAVGTVTASDEDSLRIHMFTITGGDPDEVFRIHPVSGVIYVSNPDLLDFEQTPRFDLTVGVRDIGPGGTVVSASTTVRIDLIDQNEQPTISGGPFALAENSAAGTFVGVVNASDPDAGDLLSFEIIGGDPDGAFLIDSAGRITVDDPAGLDFESNPFFDLEIEVTDDGSPIALSGTATVRIGLVDVNESPRASGGPFAIGEHALSGARVGQVSAGDPDAGDTLHYAIVAGDPTGVFEIDPDTGEIRVDDADALDHETQAFFEVTIRVRDDGTPTPLETEIQVRIDVTDQNDAPNISGGPFSIAENSAFDSLVGTVPASDPDLGDTLRYAITAGDPSGAFKIDPDTGTIRVNDPAELDFETAPFFDLSVEVDDGALRATTTIRVNLVDQNEAPSIRGGPFAIAENTAADTVVGTAAASDPDAGDTLEYAITAGDPSGAFKIDPATGLIRVDDAALLDFETTPWFDLVVQVDDGALATVATIRVNLIDRNEAPTISGGPFAIAEDSAADAIVGAVAATDPDAGAALDYTLLAGDPSGAFKIDSATGVIRVDNPDGLDFETTPWFDLVVQVDDGALAANATIRINLLDQNEAPSISGGPFAIAENSATDTIVGTATASDPDAGAKLDYAIIAGDPGGGFKIDPATGLIRIDDAAELDFETTPSFDLVVQVDDGVLVASTTIHIDLVDQNEAPDIIGGPFAIAENSAADTIVGTASGTDPDAGDTLRYAIIAGDPNGAFKIDPTTGVIRVNDAAELDFETTPSFDLVVRATDAGALAATTEIRIDLIDRNEAPLVTGGAFALDENSPAGTVAANVSATDPDTADVLRYSIVSGNTEGAFAIDPLTGEIRVANSGALDFEQTPVFDLVVQASDGGSPVALLDTTTVEIRLTDRNEAPSGLGASFTIFSNTPEGARVGAASAHDPDAGDTLRYSIIGGNPESAFQIDSSTGAIHLADATVLDGQSIPVVNLLVRVDDSGDPSLHDTLVVQINVIESSIDPTILSEEPPAPPEPETPESEPEPPLESEPEPEDPEPETEPEPEPEQEVESGEPPAEEFSATSLAETPETPLDASLFLGYDARSTLAGAPLVLSEESATRLASAAESPVLIWRGVGAGVRLLHHLAENLPASERAFIDLQIEYMQDLDQLRQDVEAPIQIQTQVVGSSLVLATGISVGYVLLLTRGGLLLASLVSSMPAWRLVDPLPILASLGAGRDGDDSDAESLASLFQVERGVDE